MPSSFKRFHLLFLPLLAIVLVCNSCIQLRDYLLSRIKMSPIYNVRSSSRAHRHPIFRLRSLFSSVVCVCVCMFLHFFLPSISSVCYFCGKLMYNVCIRHHSCVRSLFRLSSIHNIQIKSRQNTHFDEYTLCAMQTKQWNLVQFSQYNILHFHSFLPCPNKILHTISMVQRWFSPVWTSSNCYENEVTSSPQLGYTDIEREGERERKRGRQRVTYIQF